MSCAVVLLPGLDGTGEQFAPLLQALGSDVSTVVARYPESPADYESHRRVASTFLPRDRPYVILGESFSGPIAISLASNYPPGLIGCILCASFLVSPSPFLRLALPLLSLMPPQRVPSSIADFLVLGRFATPALRRMQSDARRGISPDTMAARLKAVALVDVSEAFHALNLPTLYLRATEDRLVPSRAAKRFLRLAQHGRIVDIEGPHFLLQAKPEAAAQEIRKFIGDLTANNASSGH
jgi:pimeloyl-[acyl-carrier protein] methyl ester esterase